MQPPKPCTGSHQKGWDLEGVEGATPHTSLTQLTFKTMTAFNTDYQNTELLDQELTDDQLEAVAGGAFWMIPAVLPIAFEVIRQNNKL